MFFKQKIDLRKRDAMIQFLTSHFRYYTLSSWNQSTAYANCVKLYQLELEKSIYEKAYDMLQIPSFLRKMNCLITDFLVDKPFSVGFNGRSSGYLVMYVKEGENVYPGRSIDKDENFADWDIRAIRERVKEVMAFDELCDRLRALLIWYCKNYNIEENTVMIPKKVKVLTENAS